MDGQLAAVEDEREVMPGVLVVGQIDIQVDITCFGSEKHERAVSRVDLEVPGNLLVFGKQHIESCVDFALEPHGDGGVIADEVGLPEKYR